MASFLRERGFFSSELIKLFEGATLAGDPLIVVADREDPIAEQLDYSYLVEEYGAPITLLPRRPLVYWGEAPLRPRRDHRA